MKNNNLTTKRFIIRKSLIGENAIITFTNKKNITFTYDHDETHAQVNYYCSIWLDLL